jgi:hypothetical protein
MTYSTIEFLMKQDTLPVWITIYRPRRLPIGQTHFKKCQLDGCFDKVDKILNWKLLSTFV